MSWHDHSSFLLSWLFTLSTAALTPVLLLPLTLSPLTLLADVLVCLRHETGSYKSYPSLHNCTRLGPTIPKIRRCKPGNHCCMYKAARDGWRAIQTSWNCNGCSNDCSSDCDCCCCRCCRFRCMADNINATQRSTGIFILEGAVGASILSALSLLLVL